MEFGIVLLSLMGSYCCSPSATPPLLQLFIQVFHFLLSGYSYSYVMILFTAQNLTKLRQQCRIRKQQAPESYHQQ